MKDTFHPTTELNEGGELLATDLIAALNAPIRYWIRLRNPAPPATPSHLPPRSTPDLVYLSPQQVARMWGTAHDKILEFIKNGELAAFNVAAKTSSRPRYKITLAAVKQFEEGHAGRDPARVPPAPRQQHQRPRASQPAAKKYF
jgi:hypothetical protein